MKMKRELKKKGLRLQVIPFSEIRDFGISERVKKLLGLVMANKIIILQGRLRPEEEARLIEDTMAMVDHVKNFTGIELAVIEPDLKEKNIFMRMKNNFASKLIGNSNSLTVIGPASLIKEIKKDPKKIELLLG